MRLFPATALACALFFFASGDGDAQPRPQGQPTDQVLTNINAQLVAGILQQNGYPAEIVSDQNGAYIKTAINNTNVAVAFYSCDNQGSCRSFEFWTYWSKDPGLNERYANAWNAKYLFARAYVDADGDFDFVMDVNADGGITAKTI